MYPGALRPQQHILVSSTSPCMMTQSLKRWHCLQQPSPSHLDYIRLNISRNKRLHFLLSGLHVPFLGHSGQGCLLLFVLNANFASTPWMSRAAGQITLRQMGFVALLHSSEADSPLVIAKVPTPWHLAAHSASHELSTPVPGIKLGPEVAPVKRWHQWEQSGLCPWEVVRHPG